MRGLLLVGVAGVGVAVWWRYYRCLHLHLTSRGLHEGSEPIDLAAAVSKARATDGRVCLRVDADAYDGDYVAIWNLFKREKLQVKVKLPATPLLPYPSGPEMK